MKNIELFENRTTTTKKRERIEQRIPGNMKKHCQKVSFVF